MQAGGRKNRRYRHAQGGLLAWKLCGKRGVIDDVVVLRSCVSLGVYQREEGEETINTSKQMQHDA